MELRATREMRRNEQLSKAMAKKAAADTPAKAPASRLQGPTDKVSLSQQALAWLEEQSRKMREQDDDPYGLEAGKRELELLEKALDVQEKCLKIAASIMKGNRVPPEDLEYLMNNDPEGYKLAMALRRENPDPEDEKSVLDDEDKNGSSERSDGGEGREISSVSVSESSAVE